MTKINTPTAEHLLRPELRVIWAELARRLNKGDEPTTLSLKQLHASNQQAIADLLGLDRLPGTTMRMPLVKLLQACQLDDTAELTAIAEQVCGPIVNQKVVRASQQREKETLWDTLRSDLLTLPYATKIRVDSWIELQRSKGTSHDKLQAQRQLYQQTLTVLERLPANDLGLAVFAADALGDPHALDSTTALGRLSIDAFCALNDLPCDRDADSWRRQWQWAGVLPDGVSSTVLALGVQGCAEPSMSDWLLNSAQTAEPVVLTYRQLTRWPVTALPANQFAVVMENPSLIEAAAQAGLTEVPLICSAGQPTLAVRRLIAQLGANGATVFQHADFDPAGLHITRWLNTHLNTTPWKMTAEHYLHAINTLTTSLYPMDTTPVPDTPWDDSLQSAMMDARIVISEEQVRADLLEGILAMQDG